MNQITSILINLKFPKALWASQNAIAGHMWPAEHVFEARGSAQLCTEMVFRFTCAVLWKLRG